MFGLNEAVHVKGLGLCLEYVRCSVNVILSLIQSCDVRTDSHSFWRFSGEEETQPIIKAASVSMGTSLVAQLVKNLPAMQETPVRFLGWEDPLEKG